MRTILAFLVFVLLSQIGFSQDLIVTANGDSINCKITKVKSDNIYFTFRHKDEIRNTLLPLEKVSYHVANFFQNSELPKDNMPGYKNYRQWRFGIRNGAYWRQHTVGF